MQVNVIFGFPGSGKTPFVRRRLEARAARAPEANMHEPAALRQGLARARDDEDTERFVAPW